MTKASMFFFKNMSSEKIQKSKVSGPIVLPDQYHVLVTILIEAVATVIHKTNICIGMRMYVYMPNSYM
jgi:hypothetical protein